MKKVIIHPLSINPVCKTWSREKFIRQLSAQFPDHDIEAYADSLGLISEAVAPEAPPAIPSYVEGDEAPGGIAVADSEIEDTATSSVKTKKTAKGGKK